MNKQNFIDMTLYVKCKMCGRVYAIQPISGKNPKFHDVKPCSRELNNTICGSRQYLKVTESEYLEYNRNR